MSTVNVALIGATGSLGSHILAALLAEQTFTVTVLQRASSTTIISPQQLPPPQANNDNNNRLRITKVPDDPSLDELTTLFTGQDAVIVCYRPRDAAAQIKFGQASYRSGTVRRFIPADFGSCDSNGARERALVPLFERKVEIRASLQGLADESSSSRPYPPQQQGGHEGGGERVEFSWTSLVNGHFFDWGLRENFLHFDLAARTAGIIDDGAARSSQATLAQIARATVRVLQRPEETKNKMLFIQSFCVSQNEVLAALERAMGVSGEGSNEEEEKKKKWEVTRYDSEAFIREKKALADGGDLQAVEDLVFVLGAIDGNWEGKPDFAMELLGLEEEDLDEVVQKVVDELGLST